MDATATATASSPFSMESKFDLATLLKNVAAAAAASSAAANSMGTTAPSSGGSTMIASSTATSPNSVGSSVSTNGGVPTASPSPPNSAAAAAGPDLKPISAASLAPPGVYQRRQLPFTPIKPSYAPSGHGRQILVYDSRSHPGRRREFAYKTRFTNQSGLTTVYYRCMACRALRHRLQRVMPKEKLPALQVPCIAVKNDLLINDPDFPDASDHFCSPLTIDESNQRLQNTFERGHKRARMKMANSAVEETIRKVGRLSAAAESEQQRSGAAAEENGEEMSIDLWTRAAGTDGSADSSAMLLDLHGLGAEGSDCSSDSLVVDVIKEEVHEEEGGGTSETTSNINGTTATNGGRLVANGDNRLQHTERKFSATELFQLKNGGGCAPSKGTTSNSPSTHHPPTRTPRKKLDTLLRLAELRAAASATSGNENAISENGGNATTPAPPPMMTANRNSLQQQQMGKQQLGAQQCSSRAGATATAIPTSPMAIQFNSLGGLLQNHHHHHNHTQHNSAPNNNNTSAISVQSIHAIASRLGRAGTNAAAAASELSKALGGKQSQKGGFLLNGGGAENNNAKMGGAAGALSAQQQQLMAAMLGNGGGGGGAQLAPMVVGELLKKYVENNADMGAGGDPANGGAAARNAGELACTMFMAQAVENVELRQEVQKLRAELDSLKALVAAAAVVGGNNHFGGGNGAAAAAANGHCAWAAAANEK